MNALVTGSNGMLGRAVVDHFSRRGHDVVALSRTDLDVTRRADVRAAFERHAPEVVVQCAAYTAVDDAESNEDEAFRINARATEGVVAECQRIGATFVYPSTDYVFSGESRTPWKTGDTPAPVNAYGRSKLAGERAALSWSRSLVVRTSWLYGSGGRNFVDRITELARENRELDVVDDQIGSPTWTDSLADVIAELVEVGVSGTFHASGGGEPVSWYAFAIEIIERQGLAARVRPVTSASYPRPARRPLNSVLDCRATEAAIGREMPSWRVMLEGYLQSRSLVGARD